MRLCAEPAHECHFRTRHFEVFILGPAHQLARRHFDRGRNQINVIRHQHRAPIQDVTEPGIRARLAAPVPNTAQNLALRAVPALCDPRSHALADTLALTPEQEQLCGPQLTKLLTRRVAYHHSGLSYAQRAGVIEPLAKAGQLRAVVATLGLSAGSKQPPHTHSGCSTP
jgi:superfamily II RNA helicase